MFSRFAPLALAALALMVAALAAPARANPYAGMVEVSVRPGWQLPDGGRMAALHITLKPGWKTYWRAPGDAGVPPIITWNRSRNIAGAQFTWPTPIVFRQNGLRSIGYQDTLILPVRLTPGASGKPLRFTGSLQIGICNDICVPVDLDFDQLLPAATAARPDPLIAAALADRPFTAAQARVSSVTCTLSPAPDGLHIRASLTLPSTGTPEHAVFETNDPAIWASEARITRHGNTLTAESTLIHATSPSFALDRSAIRITVLGTSHAVDIQGCPAS